MLYIKRFVVNMIQENCYLLYDEEKRATIVDCGAFFPEERKAIDDFIEKEKLTLTQMCNTHGHFDHLFGAHHIYESYGVKLQIAKDEEEIYATANLQAASFMGNALPVEPCPVGRWLHEGDEITIGQTRWRVIATPGHTPGGICLYCPTEKVLLSGDSLFRHEIGRCDLPGGSETQLIDVLKRKVLSLPGEVVVLPGHGPQTTIEEERTRNPYLR